MKYAYPAVFTFSDEDRCYYVRFPDLKNCFTDGEALPDAMENAADVLALMLCQMEDDNSEIPEASDIRALCPESNGILSLILADTSKYRRQFDTEREIV